MSEILAFSESADSDPKLSTEPVSESGDIHTATDVPPKEAPAPEPDSPEAETFHLRKKRILTRIFHRKISNLLTIPKKIRLPEKRKVPTTTFSIQQRN